MSLLLPPAVFLASLCLSNGQLPILVSAANSTTTTCVSPGIHQDVIENVLPEISTYLNEFYGHECGGTDGWTEVAKVDMSADDSVCPNGWTLHTDQVRGCGRQGDSDSASTIFSVGRAYSKVCGSVLAIQKGTPDGFGPYILHKHPISSNYVDGVSLTYRPMAGRRHIWTFAAAFSTDTEQFQFRVCPCNQGWPLEIPSFIGNNYFCEAGSSNPPSASVYYVHNTLWDGRGCRGPSRNCCSFNSPPTFSVFLPQATTSDLEMRILLNEHAQNENIIVTKVDLFVK